MAKRVNYGFGAIERMPNNIARVEILGFPPILDDDSRAAVGEQMSKVADADAVIFDLRNNGGGSPDTVALFLSYVFDKPTHINSMYSRDTGKTEESWTLSDVKGKRFGGKKPVFVVTSNRTFSGGEEFTYDLQTQRRATIVGETTGGGAHPVEGHPLEGGFGVGAMGLDPGAAEHPLRVLIVAPLVSPAPEAYRNGVSVITRSPAEAGRHVPSAPQEAPDPSGRRG